jgi:kynurenine formamidase
MEYRRPKRFEIRDFRLEMFSHVNFEIHHSRNAPMTTRRWLIAAAVGLLGSSNALAQVSPRDVRDLSLTVSPELPCVWPLGMTPLAIVPTKTFGLSAYHRDQLIIDEHTGTQWDAPAHFVPPPDSGFPGAGPNGLITSEKVPVWQFVGEACVIDVRDHIDDAPDGSSFLIGPEIVQAWEEKNRPLKFGDVVLFRSDYTDRYYQPFPQGERFVATALRKDTPGWPAPKPETMTYLADKGVMTLGLDGASMGPLPDLAAATHQAGGQRGMIWVECETNLGSLPTTGAFYAMLPAKHAGGSGGECRTLGITDRDLAAKLIASSRAKQVVDLSVTLDEEYPITWPGYGPGEEAGRYVGKTLNAFSPARGPYFARTHMLDSYAGTHLALPSFSLPPHGFDDEQFAEPILALQRKYVNNYGRRGHSDVRTEQVPLSDLMGTAHVVDVRSLVTSARSDLMPTAPEITADFLKKHAAERPFKPGEIVIFFSGYSDSHMKPLPAAPEVDGMFVAPLTGKAEGWPAPNPGAINFLADKGIRCLGTDSPILGSVDREQALFTNWTAASRGMLVIEYLTNVGSIADKPDAFFLFAPVKIKGTRGGYGRAIALW